MNRTIRVALLGLLSLVIVGGCKKSEPATGTPEPALPQLPAEMAVKAPDFTLIDQNGTAHTLSGFAGKIVVLEWLNPDCPFVKRHHETKKTMVNLAKAYADKGVVWLGINTTHYFDNAKNKEFVTRLNLPYPVLNDRDGKVGKLYGATRTPEMFIIHKDGTIAYHGAIDDDPKGDKTAIINYVQQALDELLAGKPVSVPHTSPYGCTVKYAE